MACSGTVSSFFLCPATKAAAPGIPLRSLNFTTRATPAQHRSVRTSPPPQEDKCFAVATEGLLLGIASLILENALAVEAEKGEWWWWWRWKERIATVVEDPIQPEVVWDQRVKGAESERKGVSSPGFSFSAAGLMFPYHLGVAQLLIEKGYIKETTPLAGSSAGAIVCAAIASEVSMRDALEATKILAENCRLQGTAFRLGAVLRNMLEQSLPDDVHIRSNGRVCVAVTEILWRPRNLLVDQFDSKEDFIDAVVASSFIPGYLAPTPATLFRNRLCIDGGLTSFVPPTSASQTVRVCPYPASRLGLQGIGISPDCNPENMPSLRELLNWSLEPAADDVLDKIFELGYRNAAIWAEKNPIQVNIS